MVPKIRWLVGVGLAFALASNSLALSVTRISSGILLEGEIRAGDFQRVKSSLDGFGNLPLLLNSPGGRVGEALQIAELVRSRKLTTHLPANATCASACVLIFAGGVVRTADRSARIGVHMGSGLLNDEAIQRIRRVYLKYGAEGAAVVATEFEQAAAQSVLRQVNFFLASGVSLRLLQLATSVSHLDVHWLSLSESREFNIVNAD